MSSTQSDAVADLMVSDPVTFASLPLPLAQRIFLALAPDARGRASCVCRAWRDVLSDPSLWARLDTSDVRVERHRVCAVFHGAARRARGLLRELDVSKHGFYWQDLLPVLTANAGSLRVLHMRTLSNQEYTESKASVATFEAVMAAAPLLQVLTAEQVGCTWEDAARMLRADEQPFASLQLSDSTSLDVRFSSYFRPVRGMERFGPFAAALADAALQPALLGLCISCADTAQPALMGALVDAVLARRLRELRLKGCTPPAAAPLARLLAEGSLTTLQIGPAQERAPLIDAAGAALVAGALRVNTTLEKLILRQAGLHYDINAAEMFLGALIGHRSLREFQVILEEPSAIEIPADERFAFGAALAALIAADAPALLVLNCSGDSLRDVGLAPIVEALVLNHHLRALNLCFNGMSEAFARDQLLPALRANTTLRWFALDDYSGPPAAEAEELVRRRGQHS